MFNEFELEVIQDALQTYLEVELTDAYLSEIQFVEDLQDKVVGLIDQGE